MTGDAIVVHCDV